MEGVVWVCWEIQGSVDYDPPANVPLHSVDGIGILRESEKSEKTDVCMKGSVGVGTGATTDACNSALVYKCTVQLFVV